MIPNEPSRKSPAILYGPTRVCSRSPARLRARQLYWGWSSFAVTNRGPAFNCRDHLRECSQRACPDRVVTLAVRSGLISLTEREPHHIPQRSRTVRAKQSLQHSYSIGNRYLAVTALVQRIEECTLIGCRCGRNRPFHRARLALIA